MGKLLGDELRVATKAGVADPPDEAATVSKASLSDETMFERRSGSFHFQDGLTEERDVSLLRWGDEMIVTGSSGERRQLTC